MPVTSSWHDEAQTLIYQRYTGQLNAETAKDGIIANRRLFLSVEHTVDVIMDFRGCKVMPFSMLQMGSLAEATAPPNVGQGVVITDDTGSLYVFTRTFVQLGKTLGSPIARRTQFAPDLNAALELLGRHNGQRA